MLVNGDATHDAWNGRGSILERHNAFNGTNLTLQQLLPLPLGLFIALNGNIRPVSYIQQMVIPHKSVKVNLTIRNRPYAGLSLLKV